MQATDLLEIDQQFDQLSQSYLTTITLYLPSGCIKARTKNPCTMCGFHLAVENFTQTKTLLKAEEFINLFQQLDFLRLLIEQKNIVLKIYTGGSWFDVPTKARQYIGQNLGQFQAIKTIYLESRPEMITKKSIAELRQYWPQAKLCLGIGLEAQDDYVRETLINKGFDKETFEKAIRLCQEHQIKTLAYVLIKPFGLSEAKAIEEAINTCQYCFDLQVDLVSFESTFIQAGTFIHEKYEQGEIKPPWLWSIIKVLKETYKLGKIRLGRFTDFPPPIAVPQNYEKQTNQACERGCSSYVYELLDQYRIGKIDFSQALQHLPPCSCLNHWENKSNLKL